MFNWSGYLNLIKLYADMQSWIKNKVMMMMMTIITIVTIVTNITIAIKI